MRRLFGPFLLVMALLLSQAQWEPPRVGTAAGIPEYTDGKQLPVFRESKTLTTRDARSKQAPAGSGDLLPVETGVSENPLQERARLRIEEQEILPYRAPGRAVPRAPPVRELLVAATYRA